MKKCLSKYVSEFEKELNVPLMNKEADLPLVDYVVDCWKSLEAVSAIKFVGYDYTEKESEIDVNKYIFKREKKKRKKDRHNYKFISDDRVGRLTCYLEISLKETDKDTGKEFIHKYPIKKAMLIPLQNDEGFYRVRGKDYYLIYQMVEKSTYTSSQSITLKSLMPVCIKRNIIEEDELLKDNLTNEKLKRQGIEVYDVIGKHYTLPVYYVFVFKKEIPVILFYLSKGISFTLDFLEVSNVISFVKHVDDVGEQYIYFSISSKCILKVNRAMFDKYPYIQSIVGSFLTVCTNRTTIESLNDPKQWIKKISNPNNYEKGLDILKFFNRLLDETTKKILRIHDYHTENIYTLLRWMMQEFNSLRLKDNLDLKNKRLRCNEHIAGLLTIEFSKRLNRVISLGDRADIEKYREIFKFPGDRQYVAVKPI